MSMDRYLDELESSLKHLDIPFERAKVKIHDYHDEVLAYPSFENCRYSYRVEYCSCCGRARDAGLYDHSNEAESPNFIRCTPESAFGYICDDWHNTITLKNNEWLRCRFVDEESAMGFVNNLKRNKPSLTFLGPEYDVNRNDWEVLVENKEVDKNGTAAKT